MRYASLLGAALVTSVSTSAYPHVVCHDDHQVVNGREIAAPYCQDNTLAQVSRGYGRRVSDAPKQSWPQG